MELNDNTQNVREESAEATTLFDDSVRILKWFGLIASVFFAFGIYDFATHLLELGVTTEQILSIIIPSFGFGMTIAELLILTLAFSDKR